MLNEGWFSQTIGVDRYASSVVDRREVGSWSSLYESLRCAVAGVYSKVDPTMLGHIPIDEYWITVRVGDIDSEVGWPEENDRVTLAGSVYYIISVSDQTMNAGFFTIPPHKIIKVSRIPLTPLDAD